MPRATWPIRNGSPSVRVVLTLVAGNQPLPLLLLADTGAGTMASSFDLILEESDCLLCGGLPQMLVRLGGAYAGKTLNADGVKALASIPSKEVLLSQLLGLMQSPISRLARVLAAVAEKRGEAAAPEAVPAADPA